MTKIQGDGAFHGLSEYIFAFVITCSGVENKFEKINGKSAKMHCISGEFNDERTFILLFIFNK